MEEPTFTPSAAGETTSTTNFPESSDRMMASTQEEQVVHEPLLIGKKRMKVMVAIDESDGSFYALNWALSKILIKPTAVAGTVTSNEDKEGSMVYLIHVQHHFQSYVFPAGAAVYAPSSVVDSVRKGQQEIAASLFSRALRVCQDKMVRAETLVMEGDPKEMICQAVEQMHIDLLVIGSRGLGQIKRAFLGSVSDYCSHHANCPVLIVKPPPPPHKSSNKH